MSTEVTPIPSLRRVYKDTKANLDALTGLQDEDLAYGTDTTILYRQNGAGAANWEALTSLAGYGELTVVALFQLIGAFGTFASNPQSINDKNTGSLAKAQAIDEYAEVVLPSLLKITQFRQYGVAANNGDGYWKIQYKNIAGNWVDWVTGIGTRTSASWGGWDSSGGEVIASAIRLVCTTVDTNGEGNLIGELEVKY